MQTSYFEARVLPQQGSRLLAGMTRLPIINRLYTGHIDNADNAKKRIIEKHDRLWEELDSVQKAQTESILSMAEMRYAVEDHFETWSALSGKQMQNVMATLNLASIEERHDMAKHFTDFIEAEKKPIRTIIIVGHDIDKKKHEFSKNLEEGTYFILGSGKQKIKPEHIEEFFKQHGSIIHRNADYFLTIHGRDPVVIKGGQRQKGEYHVHNYAEKEENTQKIIEVISDFAQRQKDKVDFTDHHLTNMTLISCFAGAITSAPTPANLLIFAEGSRSHETRQGSYIGVKAHALRQGNEHFMRHMLEHAETLYIQNRADYVKVRRPKTAEEYDQTAEHCEAQWKHIQENTTFKLSEFPRDDFNERQAKAEALMVNIVRGCADQVEYALEGGADLTYCNKEGFHPLYRLVEQSLYGREVAHHHASNRDADDLTDNNTLMQNYDEAHRQIMRIMLKHMRTLPSDDVMKILMHKVRGSTTILHLLAFSKNQKLIDQFSNFLKDRLTVDEIRKVFSTKNRDNYKPIKLFYMNGYTDFSSIAQLLEDA